MFLQRISSLFVRLAESRLILWVSLDHGIPGYFHRTHSRSKKSPAKASNPLSSMGLTGAYPLSHSDGVDHNSFRIRSRARMERVKSERREFAQKHTKITKTRINPAGTSRSECELPFQKGAL